MLRNSLTILCFSKWLTAQSHPSPYDRDSQMPPTHCLSMSGQTQTLQISIHCLINDQLNSLVSTDQSEQMLIIQTPVKIFSFPKSLNSGPPHPEPAYSHFVRGTSKNGLNAEQNIFSTTLQSCHPFITLPHIQLLLSLFMPFFYKRKLLFV